MSENETSVTNSQPSEGRPSRFPRKTLIWTLLVVSLLVAIHWSAFWLNENFNMDPAIPGILTVLLGFITYVLWMVWAFFLGRRPLVGILIFLVPVLFFVFYMPNIKGDVNLAGFKPRFWATPTNYVETVTESSGVDLGSTEFDFNQFLGSNRNGIVDGIQLSEDWDSPPKVIWRQDVGEGWSGFVVVNGFAITQEQRAADECVTCYEVETGKLCWINRMPRRHEDTMAMGKVGPRATPTIDDGLIYITSAVGYLECLDGRNGDLLWSVDIPKLVGIEQVSKTNSLGLDYTEENSPLMWGRSCSPLILDDLVVVPAGGPLPSSQDGTSKPSVTLIAFDKKTGEEKWRGGKRMISYGSPSIATIAGKRQILLMAESHAVGHDAETGEELWSHERPGNTGQDANCSQVTIVDENHVIASKGYSLGGELIQVSHSDGKWATQSIHKDPRVLKTKLTSPVVYQGHAYSLSDGFLECVEIESFRRKWKQRGRFGNGQILLVGDKLLVHAESGRNSFSESNLYLVKASPESYQELGKVKTIFGICWNTLCLYKDLLLIRSDREAICLKIPLIDSKDSNVKSELSTPGESDQ
ncbi:MAG: PQQ-binding-like beta-propeller repeat protein [Planctomycetota bacterium]